ncbi:MAG TPA: hypothetical protein VE978_05570, partial [Chitinophagales bacterium]|nr:hypothetical protein [Chitinophagales bacterium]
MEMNTDSTFMKSNSRNICFSILFVSCICALLFFSCKKTSYPPVAIDQSYFPLVTGKYIIYDVDSLGYWGFNDTIIHHTYQIKEEVDSPYIDNAGNHAFRIIRSRRNDASSSWVVTDIWSSNLTDQTAEKVEENLRFIKLDFPIILNKQWYGNNYIQADSNLVFLNGWRYEYTSVHQPLTLNGLSFDSTVTVSQDLDSNAIQQYIYIEK